MLVRKQRRSILRERLREFERGLIVDELRKAGGVILRACDELGITEHRLRAKVHEYGIDLPAIRREACLSAGLAKVLAGEQRDA